METGFYTNAEDDLYDYAVCLIQPSSAALMAVILFGYPMPRGNAYPRHMCIPLTLPQADCRGEKATYVNHYRGINSNLPVNWPKLLGPFQNVLAIFLCVYVCSE